MTATARIAHGACPATRPHPAFRSRRPADRGERLARALVADAARFSCTIGLTVATVEPWSSATFSGSVITLTLDTSPDAALSDWLAELPERDIPLGRDVVADIAVEPGAQGLRLRALLCLDAANG